MKLLRTIFDIVGKRFEQSRILRPFKPLFDATDAFFFGTAEVTPGAPHVRDALDTKRYMATVIVAAMPALAAAVYLFGLRILAMVVVSYVFGGIAEVVFCIVRKEEITEGFLVTGLLFPLTLPPGTPLWVVAAGVVFGVVIGKEIFGGTGTNIFNPAFVGRCFLAIAYPQVMASGWVAPKIAWPGRLLQYAVPPSDVVTGATPLVAADWSWTAVARAWLGNVPGCAGETCAWLIIAGGVFLCFTRVANWRVPVGSLFAVAVFSALMNRLVPGKFAPPLFQLAAGGLMLGVFFMATDPVSSPITNPAKWAYAVGTGILTVLIRALTGYPEGVMFSILLMNAFAPLLDETIFALRRRKYARAR